MRAKDYTKLIEKLNTVQGIVKVELKGIGDIELTLSDIMPIIEEKRRLATLSEYRGSLKERRITHKEIADALGINKILFHYLITGTHKSNKEVGDTYQFIAKCEEVINNQLL